jgi:hypothetical protein
MGLKHASLAFLGAALCAGLSFLLFLLSISIHKNKAPPPSGIVGAITQNQTNKAVGAVSAGAIVTAIASVALLSVIPGEWKRSDEDPTVLSAKEMSSK